jgi:esterase/PHB depolymerase
MSCAPIPSTRSASTLLDYRRERPRPLSWARPTQSLYAAKGVHSGLACGVANDIPSAFAAMRQGELSACSNSVDMLARLGNGPAVPTIVFQGDPRNADYVIAQCRTTKLQEKIHRGRCLEDMHTPARSIPTRTGRWSGGSPAGSYTDPRGPDAAQEMLRFFLDHPRPIPREGR